MLLRAHDQATASQLGALVASLLATVAATALMGGITVVSEGRYRHRHW